MAYQHLTQEERYQIYALRKAGFCNSHTAVEIGRSPSTIGRELRRNHGRRGYRPGKAGELARRRAREGGQVSKEQRPLPQLQSRAPKRTGALLSYVR